MFPLIKRNKKKLLYVFSVSSLFLSGCVSTPPPLYRWESYQPQVYEYFKGDGKGYDSQVIALEEGIQKIKAEGKTPPPGYYAHLGLLYSHTGKGDQLIKAFQMEQQLYPEATTYMNFLTKKLAK